MLILSTKAIWDHDNKKRTTPKPPDLAGFKNERSVVE